MKLPAAIAAGLVGLALLAAGGRADEPPASLVQLTFDGYFKQRPAWSPDGSRLAFTRHKQDKLWIYTCDAAGGDERRLTNRELPEYDAAWSPDGRRLAFVHVSQSGTQGDLDIYVAGADGSGLAPVVRTQGPLSHEEWPAWSPDGKQIAFTSTRPGNQEIMLAQADGSQVRAITSHSGTDAHPCWSPDGRQIAFATDRWGGLEIAVMQADGSQIRRLTTSTGLDDYPAWSPDGRSIAFVSNRDGNFEIYLMAVDGSQPRNLTDSPSIDTFPAWIPDGRLTFVSNRHEQFDIFVLKVGGQ
jgi:TolB protein